MFSIGEIADTIGITRRIILNYEAKGLIKPDQKIGTNGNRYYSIDTFTQIRTIRIFQNLGLTLDEIREYFNETIDLKSIIKRLEDMRDELNHSIEKLYERANGGLPEIKRIEIAPQTVYCRACKSETVSERTAILRETALEAMKKHGTDTTRRMYFTEFSADDPNYIYFCVAVPRESEGKFIKRFDKIAALAVFHHGAYEKISETEKMISDYAKRNGICLSGICRHLYVEGPPQHSEESKYITQIIMPIKA